MTMITPLEERKTFGTKFNSLKSRFRYSDRSPPKRKQKSIIVYGTNARSTDRSLTLTQSDLKSRVMELEKANRSLTLTQSDLKSRVMELEKANRSLSLPLSKETTENTTSEKGESTTLSMLCERYNIQEFPESLEALRGLISELDIKESSTEIIRDVRDNP